MLFSQFFISFIDFSTLMLLRRIFGAEVGLDSPKQLC